MADNELPDTSKNVVRLVKVACVEPLITSAPSIKSEPVVTPMVDELAKAARPVTEIEVLVVENVLEP